MIFLENIWIWFGLAFVVVAIGYYVFLNDRKIRTLGITAGAVVAVLAVGFSLYFFVDTDRKSISRMLTGLATAIEQDDLESILEHYVAPRATRTRSLARVHMGYARITSARFRDLKFEVNHLTSPPTAQVAFTATFYWFSKNLAELPLDRPTAQIVKFNVELERGPNGGWLVTDQCDFKPSLGIRDKRREKHLLGFVHP